MPDTQVNPSDFVQMMTSGPDNLCLPISQGNTIIFDSFTPEVEVRKRNTMKNNVSKLNQDQCRFSSEFTVRIGAPSITAILCAKSVRDYKVVDNKTGETLIASDKRPKHLRTPQLSDDSSDSPDIHTPVKAIQLVQPGKRPLPDNSAASYPAPVMDKIFFSPPQQQDKFRKITQPPRTPYQEKVQNTQFQPFRTEYICTHPEGIYRRPPIPAFLLEPPATPLHPPVEPTTTTSSLALLANYADSLIASNMYFASTDLSPREVDDSEVAVEFPFKAAEPNIEKQSMLAFSPYITPNTSDNITTVVSMGDVMDPPSYQSAA